MFQTNSGRWGGGVEGGMEKGRETTRDREGKREGGVGKRKGGAVRQRERGRRPHPRYTHFSEKVVQQLTLY